MQLQKPRRCLWSLDFTLLWEGSWTEFQCDKGRWWGTKEADGEGVYSRLGNQWNPSLGKVRSELVFDSQAERRHWQRLQRHAEAPNLGNHSGSRGRGESAGGPREQGRPTSCCDVLSFHEAPWLPSARDIPICLVWLLKVDFRISRQLWNSAPIQLGFMALLRTMGKSGARFLNTGLGLKAAKFLKCSQLSTEGNSRDILSPLNEELPH